MIEPVAYRVDNTIYNNLIDAEYAVREIEHLRNSIGIDNGLIIRSAIIEPLYTEDQLQNKIELTKTEFELLAKVCRGIQPFQKIERHIKIVQEKKWFVQKKNFNGNYKFLNINAKDLSFNHTKDRAARFDTKEEADKWTNPITEAVHLPVEG